MAKRKRSSQKKGKGKTQYARCLSRQMKGNHAKTKKAKSRLMKRVQRKCGGLR